MHDVAWITNPYSPYAPGERGSDQPPVDANGGGNDGDVAIGGGGASVYGGGERGEVNPAGVEEKPAFRLPAFTARHTHRVARD